MDKKKAIGVGIALGLAFGVAIHNFALGILLGVAIGAAFAAHRKNAKAARIARPQKEDPVDVVRSFRQLQHQMIIQPDFRHSCLARGEPREFS